MNTRKPNRLGAFDYASHGAYFITICTKDRACLLSEVPVGATCGRPPEPVLSPLGRMVEAELHRLNTVYPSLRVAHSIIMPNHIHLLLVIDMANGRPKVAPTISQAIQQFKGAVSKKAGQPLWQKGFHDHVIRDERELIHFLQYIDENPVKWAMGKDEYYA